MCNQCFAEPSYWAVLIPISVLIVSWLICWAVDAGNLK